MGIPLYGQESQGNGLGLANKVGKIINNNGATALSLTAADSGAVIVIAGAVNGAAACSLPHINGQDGLEFTFLLVAANGTGDWDIDAKDGVDFFIGSVISCEGGTDAGIDFNGSSHDQLVLAASKGAAGDQMHVMSAGGKWWVRGVTNDLDGWEVGTASANT